MALSEAPQVDSLLAVSATGESSEEIRNKYFFWVFENSIVVDSNGAGTGLTA